MGLFLHRAERTDLLADGLGALLVTPQSDPFAEELVLVPEHGVERWLSQRLSHILGRGSSGDCVCAGVVFRRPRSLIAEVLGIADVDPWSTDTMVWTLLQVIDDSLDQDWNAALARHLGRFRDGDEAELRRGRRYAVARRIAGLFASYAAQRPQLLADWSAGGSGDGLGGELPEDLAWQPHLWRALTQRVDADPPQIRHQKILARLRESPTDLPARLSLFGHTRLPITEIELLGALATHHALHLWLPHPSDDLWGLGDVMADLHPGHQLRVRLADRALMQTNQLLGMASQLLALAGVRWGFDQRTRVAYGLGDLGQNTWRFGMDRVLAGVGMSDDSQACIGPTVPLDDVDNSRVELAGRLAEFVDRLTSVIESFAVIRPLSEWLHALRDAVVRLTRTDTGEQWQLGQLDREIADVLAAAGTRGVTPMRLADVRALLDRHLAGRPTRANFRTGTLTVCTMVPMRSVPHRVVCLVGLDDGAFPRVGAVDGDDVLARDPVTCERDIRSEDRLLLLDAICAATEKLVVTYTGAHERTGEPRPPAVPLGELLDALDQTTSAPVRERIVVRQPLQPFGIRNVQPGALGVLTPFTFDPLALVAAEAVEGARVPRPEFIGEPLRAPPPEDVSLEALVEFFRDPVKGFFRALEFTLLTDVDGVDDAMPVEIDNLQRWAVGDRMLAAMLRGSDPDADRDWALQAEMLRGTLPPGELGEQTAADICQVAADIAALARDYRVDEPRAVDVDVDLGGGRRLSGTVNDIYGERIVSVTYSKLEAKHVVGPWIWLLALAAAHPQCCFTLVQLGRSGDGTGADTRIFAPPDAPSDVLRDLGRDSSSSLSLPWSLTLWCTASSPSSSRWTTSACTSLRPHPESDSSSAWFPNHHLTDNSIGRNRNDQHG